MGNVTNYSLIRIDNCPIAVDPWYQVFQNFNPLWNVDPPESWVDSIDQVAAFEVQIITVAGLEPGELVTFNQPLLDGGLTVVSAAIEGQAVLPVILAVRSSAEQATLARANRAALGIIQLISWHVLPARVATLYTTLELLLASALRHFRRTPPLPPLFATVACKAPLESADSAFRALSAHNPLRGVFPGSKANLASALSRGPAARYSGTG